MTAVRTDPRTLTWSNLAYWGSGDGERSHVLDIAAPSDASDAPVFVFAHGGAWLGGDKSQAWEPEGGLGCALARRGAVVVSPNYRLGRTDVWRRQAEDLAAATAWTIEHAQDYGGDPLEVYVGGHSAGAHLMAFVALLPDLLAPHGLSPDDLAGAIGIAGLYDLDAFRTHDEPRYEAVRAEVIEPVFGARPERWADASPTEHVGEAGASRFLLIAGDVDPLERQMRPFEERLQAHGHPAESVVVPGADHVSVVAGESGANPVTARRIIRFMEAARFLE